MYHDIFYEEDVNFVNKTYDLLLEDEDLKIDSDRTLRLAAKCGHLALIKLLIEKGADIHKGYSNYSTSISPGGFMQTTFYLTIGDQIYSSKESPLINASAYGHHKVVKYLIDKGADISVDNNKALHIAVERGHIKIAKLLIGRSDYDCIKLGNNDILNVSLEKGNLDITEFLIKNGAKFNENTLHYALRSNQLKVIEFIIDKGVDINTEINTKLIETIVTTNTDIIDLFVKYGFDIRFQNDLALRSVIKCGQIGIVKYLIDKGANIHANDDEAIKYILEYRHHDTETIKYLIENGVNICNINDEIFFRIIKNGYIETVKCLVENGVNIHVHNSKALESTIGNNYSGYGNKTDKTRETWNNCLKIARYLIEKGANTDSYDFYSAANNAVLYIDSNIELIKYFIGKCIYNSEKFENILKTATKTGKLEIVKYLIDKRGVNINDESIKHACANEDLKILKYFINKGIDLYKVPYNIRFTLGHKNWWFTKTDDMPLFKKSTNCPISSIELTPDVSQLGCSQCLNVFEKTSLEDWLKMGNEICPMCRTGCKFYLV